MTYSVVFADIREFGLCIYDTKEIVIRKGLAPRTQWMTFIHEVVHAVDLENSGPSITESQVIKLEEGFYRLLRLNGWLK